MKPESKKTVAHEKDWDIFFQGDRTEVYTCFTIFYDDFFRLGLYWFKNPELVKECIHNLFLELWKSWDTSTEIRNKKQYVNRIFRRISYKTYTAYTSVNTVTDITHLDILHELPYEEVLIASQTEEYRINQLNKALTLLTKRQKEIIQLRYFEGRSFQEIAQITSLTERTVYNTLHNAIKVLREHLILLVYFFVFLYLA